MTTNAKRKPPVGAVRKGVDTALKAAEWLTDSDAATIALARKLADTIDTSDPSPQLAARLLDTLKALGLTAVARSELGLDKKAQEVNPLDAIRTKATGTSGRLTGAAHLHAVPQSPKPRPKSR